MEKLNQGYGYILYESNLPGLSRLEKIRLWKANDRANIFLDEQPVLTLYDRELLSEQTVESAACTSGKLDILMENMGRVNFTPIMEDQRKGIDGGIQVNGHLHFGWKIYPLPMEDLTGLDFSVPARGRDCPAFMNLSLRSRIRPTHFWIQKAGEKAQCLSTVSI